MPKLSDTMTEGTLVKWRKKNGDKVETGDVIAEVETDKATMEMEAFDDGSSSEILVAGGRQSAVGARLALLLAKYGAADGGGKPAETPKARRGQVRQMRPPQSREDASAATPLRVPTSARVKARRSRKSSPRKKASIFRASRHRPRRAHCREMRHLPAPKRPLHPPHLRP